MSLLKSLKGLHKGRDDELPVKLIHYMYLYNANHQPPCNRARNEKEKRLFSVRLDEILVHVLIYCILFSGNPILDK